MVVRFRVLCFRSADDYIRRPLLSRDQRVVGVRWFLGYIRGTVTFRGLTISCGFRFFREAAATFGCPLLLRRSTISFGISCLFYVGGSAVTFRRQRLFGGMGDCVRSSFPEILYIWGIVVYFRRSVTFGNYLKQTSQLKQKVTSGGRIFGDSTVITLLLK